MADRIPLPPIRAEEPVSSIRAALGEVCGYSHLTNYRFELEKPLASDFPPKSSDTPVVSAYTGRNAVVSVPIAMKSLDDENKDENSTVLDDYGDLSLLLDDGLQDGSALRIVLERYNVAQVRDHVVRLRSLLDGNAPSVVSLDDSDEEAETTKEEEKAEKPTEGVSKGESKESKSNGEKDADEKKAALPLYPIEKSVAVDSSKLKDYYYLSCGEESKLYLEDSSKLSVLNQENGSRKKKGKKGKGTTQNQGTEPLIEHVVRDIIPELNQLEEETRVKCSIQMSGFHPPPRSRRLLGDLAYLEVKLPDETNPIFVTAIPSGFYVNRSKLEGAEVKFDPTPSLQPCFSHELLDCLLQASRSLLAAWTGALAASKARSKLTKKLNADGHFSSLFRVAIRGDFKGYKCPAIGSAAEGIDALIHTPSWLVTIPKAELEAEESWNRNSAYVYNAARTEDDIANTFGVDFRNGSARDWNEELQTAREMPESTLVDRIERARVINKVLTDFGDASLLGIKAITDGQIAPMNPNEPARSQVYLHNNIFFSRAIDAGIETFKIAQGDKAARKSASRDVHCLGALHRMERTGLYTLATVLIDYLGTRFVCQSILPGILNGDKSHTILYGTVEAGFPLSWDQEMHKLLEETLGKLWIANRTLPRAPLTDERLAAIKAATHMDEDKANEEKKEENLSATVEISGPVEAKGIKGSDQRNYVLDMTRLTPRDANWVEEKKGGTGMWESVFKSDSSEGPKTKIPSSLADDEWTLAVLRPELVNSYTQLLLTKYAREKKKKKDAEREAKAKDESGETEGNSKSESSQDESKEKAEKESGTDGDRNALSDEDLEYVKSLRMNVNVFLPDIKSLKGIDDEAFSQLQKDEEVARKAAKFLWDQVLPSLTEEVRSGTGHQLPHDGRSLTDFLHQNGINCRYLGRLADLAQVEEKKDQEEIARFKQGNFEGLARKALPLFWLELLECEMVARAAKHVLDGYLLENGGIAAMSPMQTVASFLSALISSDEETAAQTENRILKRNANEPDEDDFRALVLSDDASEGNPMSVRIRSRAEVWQDIEQEIGRRFRYSLVNFNRHGNGGRALYIPLLRRVCQRTGVRLAAKNYEAGGKCFCGVGSDVAPSYPISPLDVIDIVPLMKHSAAHGGGFTPCAPGKSYGLPALHISLPDARTTLESAHVHHSGKALSRALDLAQEACSLYQRVAETPAHPGVVRCLDLMASILYDAQEPNLAAGNLSKSLGLLIQVKGFDSSDAINSHLLLFQMLLSGGKPHEAVKHIRAAIFLMELMGGPHHLELANAYHKLGTVYHGANDPKTALRFYKEASKRVSSDRLLEAMISKSLAVGLSHMGDFKGALEEEKKAYNVFALFLGKEHNLTKGSDQQLSSLAAAAVQQGSKMVKETYSEEEAAAADAIASELEAEEEAAAAAAEKKKKNNSKKKKGKK
eukprot:scaffold24294_cov186-Cylindrotheca_fusiformis.AAC.4